MLETEVKKLTEAIKELSALMKEHSSSCCNGNKVAEKMEEAATTIKEEKPKATETKKEEKEVTLDDVRGGLNAVVKKLGKDAAFAILNDVAGAENLGELMEVNFAAVLEACNAATQ